MKNQPRRRIRQMPYDVLDLFASDRCYTRMAKRDSRRARSSPVKSCLRARKRRRYPERARRAVEDDILGERY
eukprot:scaffold8921_cov81-Skeletonema_dohrnii-CCMP3373.AAC.3